MAVPLVVPIEVYVDGGEVAIDWVGELWFSVIFHRSSNNKIYTFHRCQKIVLNAMLGVLF
jgi:hypothetical protein